MRLSAKSRRRLLKLGSVLVLLLAVAPQVLYLGRPLTEEQEAAAVQSAPPGHEQHAEAAAKHAGHCHVGPDGCGESSGLANIASLDAPIQISNDGREVAVVDTTPLPYGFAVWQRLEKPPQTI
jgi:hypothetical protein